VIRKLVDLGFSLNELKLVLGLRRKHLDACVKVRDLLQSKLVRVRGKIRLLRSFEEQLRQDLRRQRLT
jgi:DNA-binding transcriptional MerR regulator